MLIAFRADASLQIGTGHVMRCLTLANFLRDRGAQCWFICRAHQGNLLELIHKSGFETLVLYMRVRDTIRSINNHNEQPLDHANWLGAEWREDADDTIVALGETSVDWLIVDHYALDARWESALRPRCHKIMVIDDLADRTHDCDLLLDQNLVANMVQRYVRKVPPHCGLILGSKYALLQPQYAELHSCILTREGPIRRVLIYFGGADTDNLTSMGILAFLSLERKDVTLDVVINPESPYAADIRQQVEGQKQIILHYGMPSLAPLMLQADLAIGACGTTSWERCCLGLPSLVITLAENQKPLAAELNRKRLIRWLGHKDEVSETILAQALKEIFDTGLLPDWSERCQQQVDGRGTSRVCSILMLNKHTPLRARLARLDDETLILQWANDPLVRQNSFISELIDPDSHHAWFRERLSNPERYKLYIVETDDGFPVGQVRFELSDEGWEIDYALDACARGYRLGKSLLQSAMYALRENLGEMPLLVGKVKRDNVASRRIFEMLSFECKNPDSEKCIYRFVLE